MGTKKKIKRIYNTVIIILLAAFLGYVCSRFIHFGNNEFTDDAQVKRHVTPINTRVQGFIKQIRFEEYQQVHKGDTLAVIEDSEYRLRLAQAEADLSNALSGSSVTSAGVETAQSNIHVVEAGIDEAKANMDNAERDYRRYEALLKRDAVTRQQFDNARTVYESAKARYEQAAHQRKSSALMRNEQSRRLGQSEASIKLARAAVDLAELNLSYTVIVATCDGVMGRKDIHAVTFATTFEVRHTTKDEDYWELKYMLDEIKDKTINKEYEDLTDEQKAILQFTDQSLQSDAYWGHRYFTSKCYLQSLSCFIISRG